MFNFKQYQWKHINYSLIFIIVLLSIISVIMVGFVEADVKTKKQIGGIILGFLVMAFVSMVDYHFICRFMWLLYAVNLILLLLVKFSPMGVEQFDSRRWLKVGIVIQPSELTKIILILFFAQFYVILKERMDKITTLLAALALMAAPTVLILIQTDLSTSMVIMFVFTIMIFVAGLSYKIIARILIIGIPVAGVLFWYIQQPYQVLLQPYQQERILSILNPKLFPDTMYQQNNSIQAIGSGKLYGKLILGTDSPRASKYVSVAESDFIWSVIGEEIGFIGGCIVILLLLFVVVKCLQTAKRACDDTGKYIAIGLSAMYAFQVFVNIGVATSILPNTGLPLPFVSYGLTSLISSMMGIGLIINIGLQRKNYRG